MYIYMYIYMYMYMYMYIYMYMYMYNTYIINIIISKFDMEDSFFNLLKDANFHM